MPGPVEEHLENPAEFGGEYVLPSVARNDPRVLQRRQRAPGVRALPYFQEHMEEDACEEWKGAVWPPMNATVYDGLKRYGFDRASGHLATKSTRLWPSTWTSSAGSRSTSTPEPGQLINCAATDRLPDLQLVQPDAVDGPRRAVQ